MRSKVIIGLAGLVTVLVLGGAGAFWLWRCCEMPIPFLEQTPTTAPSSPTGGSSPSEAATPSPHGIVAATPQGASAPAEGETTGAATPANVRAATPSFDVVRTEPGGEGVIAGRAAPGWTVKVVSGGAEVAEAKADAQGEWTVVLDNPLPAGQHSLSLQATPPEGGRAVASRQSVPVAVTAAPRPTLQVAKPQAGVPGSAARQTASVEQSREAGASLLPEQQKPGTYTIQRGDTLWAIAERYLGAGARYVSIFRNNRKAIRNPNLIHPEQQVDVPEE